MIRTVAVFVFVSFACVATAFSQTIEKENKIDVQKKNSSTEVSGRQLPEAKNIEPKLPDIEAKKLATDECKSSHRPEIRRKLCFNGIGQTLFVCIQQLCALSPPVAKAL